MEYELQPSDKKYMYIPRYKRMQPQTFILMHDKRQLRNNEALNKQAVNNQANKVHVFSSFNKTADSFVKISCEVTGKVLAFLNVHD